MGCEVCLNKTYSNCPVCSEEQEEEYKEVEALSVLEVVVNCPHCDSYQDVTDQVKEFLDDDLRADGLEIIIMCDNKKCKENFLITKVNY